MKRIFAVIASVLLAVMLCGCVAVLTDRTDLVGNKTYDQRLDTFEELGGSIVVYRGIFDDDSAYSSGRANIIDNIKSTMRINLENEGFPDAVIDSEIMDSEEFFLTVKVPGLESSLYDSTLQREYIFRSVEEDNNVSFSRVSLSGKTDEATRYNNYEFGGGCRAVYAYNYYVDENEITSARWTITNSLYELGYRDAVVDVNESTVVVYLPGISESMFYSTVSTRIENDGMVLQNVAAGLTRNNKMDVFEELGGSVVTYRSTEGSSLERTAYSMLRNLGVMGQENAYVDVADGKIVVTLPGVNMDNYDNIIADYRCDFDSYGVYKENIYGRKSVEERTTEFEKIGGSVATYKYETGSMNSEKKQDIAFDIKHTIIANLAELGFSDSVVIVNAHENAVTIKLPGIREEYFDDVIKEHTIFVNLPVSFKRVEIVDQLSEEEVKERDKGFVGAFAEILGKEKHEVTESDYRSVRFLKLYNDDGRIYVMVGDYDVADKYTSYVKKVFNNPSRESSSELSSILRNCKTASFQRNENFIFTELDKFDNLEVLLLDEIPFESGDIRDTRYIKCGKFVNCGLNNSSMRNFDYLNLYSVVYLDFTGNSITDWSELEAIDDRVVTGKKNGQYVLLEQFLEEYEETGVPPVEAETPVTPNTPSTPTVPKAYGKFNFGMTKEQAMAVISGPSYSHSNAIYLEDYTASYSNEDSAITGGQNCSYIELIFNDSGLNEVRVSGDYVSTWNNADMMFATIERYYGVRRNFSGELGSSTWNVVKSGVNVTVTAKIEYYEGSGYVVGLVIKKR